MVPWVVTKNFTKLVGLTSRRRNILPSNFQGFESVLWMAFSSAQIIQTESATPRPKLDSKNPQNKNMKICMREISDNHRLVMDRVLSQLEYQSSQCHQCRKLYVYATKYASICGVIDLYISTNSWGIIQKPFRKSEDQILFYGPTDYSRFALKT